MATLNPQVNTEIAYEQPVQQVSGFSALADLAGTALGTLGRSGSSGPSYSERQDQRDQVRLQGLQDGLLKANALRSQGKESEALRLERTVMTNFSRDGGDLSAGQTQELVRVTTGKDAAHVGFSQEELAANELRESPDYNAGIYASYSALPADASLEQREAYAFSFVSNKASQDIQLQNAQIDWNAGRREAFSGRIQAFRQSNIGVMAAVAQQGGVISKEMFDGSRAQWQAEKANLLAARPANIPDAEWKTIQDQINNVDATFEFLGTLAGVEGMEANLANSVAKGIQSMNEPDAMKLTALRLLKSNPDVLLEQGVIPLDDMNQFFKGLVYPPRDPANPGQDYDTELDESMTRKDAVEKLDNAHSLTVLESGVSNNQNLSNENTRLQIADNFTASMKAVNSIAKDDGQFLSLSGRRGVNTVFNPSRLDTVRRIAVQDPVQAERMASAALEAADNLYAVSATALQQQTQGMSYSFDESTGSLRIDLEAMERGGVAPETTQAVTDFANRFYGGDVAALFEDGASRLRSIGGDRATDVYNIVRGSQGQLTRVREQERLVRRLGEVRSNYGSLLQEIVGQPEGQDERMAMTGPGSAVDPAVEGLTNLIDETEGGGRYDTLFGFSNRAGKRFSDVDITQMTLDELSAFSSGEYADWSKEQLGYVATPMGRYQIVGNTLRQTMSEMGLPGDIRFTQNVQDAMFHHLASKALRGKSSPRAKREALRGVWEGFQGVSDARLDAAIARFEGSEPPSREALIQDSLSQARPTQRPSGPTTQGAPQSAPVDATSVQGTSGTTPTGRPRPEGTQTASGGNVATGSASRRDGREATREEQTAASREANKKATDRALSVLKRFGVDTNQVPTFNSREEAEQAINDGILSDGNLYIVDDEIQVVGDE